MAYAVIADVRAAAPTLSATDDEITAALAMAEALVNARAGRSFGPVTATAVTVSDVRTTFVVLDLPFTNVTAVSSDTYVFPASSYVVEPWGIRFLTPLRLDSYGRGPEVTVTATFSSPVSLLIKRATVLLALAELNFSTSTADTVLPDLPANVKSFAVEGLSVTLADAQSAGRTTTGDVTADRLIDLALGNNSGVV